MSFFKSLHRFFTCSVARQLIICISLTHAFLVSFFIVDMVIKQHDFLLAQNNAHAYSLAKTLAANSSSWVLANDVVGIEEIIASQLNFPDLEYVMILNIDGKVLGYAHSVYKESGHTVTGRYIADPVSLRLLTAPSEAHALIDEDNLIDVAAPIMTPENDQHIGWARVGLSRVSILNNLKLITARGLSYIVVAIIAGIGFAWLISRGLTNGIRTLVATVHRVSKGERNIQCQLDRHDELKNLSEDFNTMLATIKAKETQLLNADEALRLSEEKYRRLVENLKPDFFFYSRNVHGDFTYTSQSVTEVLGYLPDDFLVNYQTHLTDAELNKKAAQHIALTVQGEQQPSYEIDVFHKNGSPHRLEISEVPVFNEQGQVIAIEGLAHDITAKVLQQEHEHNRRQQVQTQQAALLEWAKVDYLNLNQALQRAAEISAHTLNVARVGVWLFANNYTELYCKNLFQRDGNYGAVSNRIKQQDYPAYFNRLLQNVTLSTTDAQHDERTCELTADYLIPLAITSMMDVPIREHGRMIGVICYEHSGPMRVWTLEEENFAASISSTISLAIEADERHRAEQSLRQHEQELRLILNNLEDAVIGIDEHGLITNANQTTEKLFGYKTEELIGTNIDVLIPEPLKTEHQGFIDNYLEADVKHVIGMPTEVTACHKNGHLFPIRLSVNELPPDRDGKRRFIGACLDLTEQKLQQDLLRRAQKMEAVGQLTGGIAHDFNNQLGIIQGYLDFLSEATAQQDKTHRWVQLAEKATQHCIGLSRQLLNFSRNQPIESEVLNLNLVLNDMQDLIKRSITPEIEVYYHLAQDLWPVNVSRADLEDAILNLVINARDAMPHGGKLTFTSINRQIDATYSAIHPEIQSGSYIQLSIADTGTGIPKQIQERIFDPFYSTKETGKGTGLGLAMVYSFAKRCHGQITLYSELGAGTCFHLLLPKSQTLTDHDSQATLSSVNADMPKGAGETILIVDDEPQLRELANTYLQLLGYNTLKADNAPAALQVLAQNPAVDLVFSDIIMPGGMNGYELAQKIAEKYPQMKILLSSGFTGNSVIPAGTEEFAKHLLYKPYNRQQLATAVHKLLNADNAADSPEQFKPLFVWTTEMDLGEESLNQGQQKLFGLFADYQYALTHNSEEVETQLNKLLDYVQQHFNQEEKALSACAYPFIDNHRRVHQLLLQEAHKRCAKLGLATEKFNHSAMLEYLGQSFTEHVLKMDKAYRSYIARNVAAVKQAYNNYS